ncbi:1-phosphofructokinase family hexose kinase [Microbacterium marinilacus]|uniref:Hexose kinase n=1 Tax=Microbacterium marinilacus TaxID=415209 RepID=A0ABP7BBJ8_9MICO|nr:1-phosphofructokinase family hexose kinase [Microbacterium marinilacus]MBY0686954.1 1-phosphofructokinase family hexose kinase [Microbacterium marinilacus]
MIVTLTMNPAVDRTILLDEPLVPGEVQQARSAREDAGGKGVNVARVLAAAGAPVTAVLPLAVDDPYAALLEDLPVRAVPIAGHARVNLAITDADGETTKVNLPGAGVGAAETAELIDAVVAACDGAAWLALCGSLPPGVPSDFYVDVALAVRARAERPPRIAVDTSGQALVEAVASGAVDLVKPNDDELIDLVIGLMRTLRPLPAEEASRIAAGMRRDVASAPDAVRGLVDAVVPHQVRAALVTLGGAGAVLADSDGAWIATPPPTEVRSTVGAGDSALAGYLLADLAGGDAAARLRSAIRHGSATAALPGTQLATPADLPAGDIPVRPLN